MWQRKGRDGEVTPGLTFASGLVFFSCSHAAVIRVFDAAGSVIATYEHGASFASSKVRTTATARPSATVLFERGMNSLSIEEILGFEV